VDFNSFTVFCDSELALRITVGWCPSLSSDNAPSYNSTTSASLQIIVVSDPTSSHREAKIITHCAPSVCADRDCNEVLAGCRESSGAFHFLGHRIYSVGGMDGTRDRGV